MTKFKPYKGYVGEVEVDVEAGVLGGEVIGLRDVVHFEGSTVREAEKAFHESVDEYLEWCRELGKAPERPFSGKVLVRMDPALHRRLVRQAEQTSTSVNSFVVESIERHLAHANELELAASSLS